jgi:hypothetical protein
MGTMFKKKRNPERERTKVEKRVESLPTSELLPWVENALYAIGKNLTVWQKTQDKYALEEARMGAEVLHVILETVKKRNP